MPYELFLALRYLRSRHKRRLARVTAVAAVIGIAMGVAALVVALALSNGFRDEMRDKILQGTAHINIVRTDGLAIDDNASVIARVRQVDGVKSASSTTYDGVLVRGPKAAASYAVLRGIEPEAAETTSLSRWIEHGSMIQFSQTNAEPQSVIGIELANRLAVKPGDVIQIIPMASSVDGNALMPRRLSVSGVFRSGLFEYDSTWIYLPLHTATSLGNQSHSASIVSVQVEKADEVKQVAERVKQKLGNVFNTVDWQQANQPLFAALALERRMGLFIIGLIIAIAVLNITTMLILVVVERRRDIAILNALGATQRGVMLVFVIEGAVVGLVGSMTGVVIGLLAVWFGNYFKIVSLPADVYSISSVPLNVRLTEVMIAALVAFALSVLATLYPARAAARMQPVETLRDAV